MEGKFSFSAVAICQYWHLAEENEAQVPASLAKAPLYSPYSIFISMSILHQT